MFEDSTHGGRQRNRAGLWGRIISTHALTEGDCHPPERRTLLMKFQLTPSRRATINLPPLALRSLISTHALTEGDSIGYFFLRTKRYFNSRPHGGRPRYVDDMVLFDSFQLTPSRRATTGRDGRGRGRGHFNSRPHGGRLRSLLRYSESKLFQLTPSRRATWKERVKPFINLFQLTPSRRATKDGCRRERKKRFQLTPSRRATIRSKQCN